ncbi:MAG TPA: hypothetical protein VKI65_03280 [Gemmataceae bacterium]|nr:hypothetical protein [Gemmataceae bacterium]
MSGGAAAAAAAEAQRKREEEEEMTPYSREDLAGDWEFKILRSMTGAFRNPATLQRVLEEEARAGWVLVEKFDNGRIRLKRPVTAKKANLDISFDPYRTYVGASEWQFVLIMLACTLGGVAVMAALIAALAMR